MTDGQPLFGLGDPRIARAAVGARTEYRRRGVRNEVLGAALFSDPAWDMLLDLFIAACDGRRLSVSSVCVGARCPSATALRYLQLMLDAGLIYREADARDGRRFYVVLHPATLHQLVEILSA